jgi:tetratricopeptide (TPR) repeat protein
VQLLVVALSVLAAAPEPRDVDDALRQAAALQAAGDPDAAAKNFEWALERVQPGTMARARALDGLSAVETTIGEYARAIGHAREAAAIYAELGQTRAQATALNRVGRAAVYAGDYLEAEKAFTSAIALSRATRDREQEAEQLGNLGGVSLYLGRYSDALDAFDQAMALVDGASSEEWSRRRGRIVLANKATLYRRLGRNHEALALYRELGTSPDVRPEERAQILVNQGVLYRRMGDPVKALHVYDRAQALFARNRHVDGELGAMKNRGIVLALDLGQLEAAERTFSHAIDLARRIGNRRELLVTHLFRGETRLRRGDAAARTDFAAGLALARELRTPDEEWKALYGLGRVEPRPEKAAGYLADALVIIEQLREDIVELALRSDFLHDKRDVYDALIAARLQQAHATEVFALIERSHSRAWRERLGLTTHMDLASIQRNLPANALLLDYWNSRAGSALVAVTRTRTTVLPVSVDEAHVKALIDGLASGPTYDWRGLAQVIARGVLPPRDWFNGIHHVIVVADGALALVPFELLGDGESLLIERAAVSYTPTAATLLQPATPTPRWAPPWRLQLQAFASPVFSSARFDDPSTIRAGVAASAREVRDVAAEISGAAALYIGAENRKAALAEQAQRAPIIHLATHATADANAMELSRIVFSPPTASSSTADYLFLRDAYRLTLGGVELAVLSACETERGPFVRGEGVQSFSRAFLAAGARSTVTTLWRVADRPTANLMKIFYHHLQRGLPRGEALRRAKLRMLATDSEIAHPHFWAAFVLTGDGVRPVPRAVSWQASVLSIVILIVLAVAADRMLRQSRRGRQNWVAKTH